MSDAPRPMPEILAELQAAVDEVSAERLRYGYIADTIRVNAVRHGATTEQVEDFIRGRASFVNWMADVVKQQGEAALEAERAKVAALVEALTLAANRLSRRAVEYIPGSRLFIETGEWADEARAALDRAKGE